MQNDLGSISAPGTPPVREPIDAASAPEPTGQPGAGGWAEIGRLIERQLRRDVARLAGAGEAEDWAQITGRLVGRAKGQAEKAEVGRRAEEISKQVEEHLRGGLAEAVGAGPDADWAHIGRTLRQRIENVIDPTSPPATGGSGTAASEEDASVPAAAPSPDQPPKPAEVGGEDTGLPTVTDDAPEPPGPPAARGSA